MNNKVINYCNRVMEFSFYALIYFVPISTALVELCSAFIITAFFVKRGAGHSFKPVPTHLNKALGLFIFINFLSVVFSHYPGLSIKGFVFKLFQGVVLFSAFVECMRTKKKIKTFVTVYLISAALISVNGLAQYFQGQGFVHGHLLQEGRIRSSLNHANDFGAYLVIVIPFLLSFVMLWLSRAFQGRYRGRDKEPSGTPIPRYPDRKGLGHRQKMTGAYPDQKGQGHRQVKKDWGTGPLTVKIGFSILFVVALACLGLTFSRGAWIGFLFALIFMVIQRRKVFYIPVLVVGVFAVVFFPKLIATRNVSFTSDNVASDRQNREQALVSSLGENGDLARRDVNLPEKDIQGSEEEGAVAVSQLEKRKPKAFQGFTGKSRTVWWREALSIIREFPALGTGLNTYSRVAPKYKLQVSGGVYPHNCYLHMTAETGLLGLASFLWILFALFRHALKSLKMMKDVYLSTVLLGILSGLGGFFVHSFFDTNFYSVKLGNLMWVMIGLSVAIQKCAGERS